MLKGRNSTWLFSAHIGTEFFALLRNIVLARLLGPSEFGRAAMIVLVCRLIEMGLDFGTDRFLISSSKGNRKPFQEAAQGIEFMRGLAGAGVAVVLAFPFASLFGVPEAAVWFAAIGLAPLFRGLTHLDCKRTQRHHNFKPQAIVELVTGALSLALCWPVILALRDYRAIPVVLILHVAIGVLLSHLVARRKYRMALDVEVLQKALTFGWPLALNSVLLFWAFQGDRFVVATICSQEELGRFVIAFQLGLLPVLVLSRVVNSGMLPIFASQKNDPGRFEKSFASGIEVLSLVGLVQGVFFVCIGGQLIHLLYGEAFSVGSILLFWLAVTQAIRLVRGVPSVAGVAIGRSKIPLVVNLFRLPSQALAAMIAVAGGGVEAIAAAGCLGELTSLLAAIWMGNSQMHIPISVWKRPGVISLAGASAAIFLVYANFSTWQIVTGVCVFAGGWLLIHKEQLFGTSEPNMQKSPASSVTFTASLGKS